MLAFITAAIAGNATIAGGQDPIEPRGTADALNGQREGNFSCRAQALRFGQKPAQNSKVANPPVNPCANDEKSQPKLSGTLGGLTIKALTLNAQTNLHPDDQSLPPEPGDRGDGEASIEKLVIKGSRKVVIRGITSYAAARCRLDGQGSFGPVLQSRSSVGSVQQGSQIPVPIGDAKLSIPLGSLGTLHLNPGPQTFSNENRSVIVQRAVWLDRPSGGDVIAGEAQGDFHGDPCAQQPPPQADLSTDVTASQDSFFAPTNIHVTVFTANGGPDDADAPNTVTTAATLPAGSSFAGFESCAAPSCSYESSTHEALCTSQTLDAGEVALCRFDLFVPASGKYTVTATASSDLIPDPNPSNNSASTTFALEEHIQ